MTIELNVACPSVTGPAIGDPLGSAQLIEGGAGPGPVDHDVAVVGLGYVGLPTALALHAAGARVAGLDLSRDRLAAIRSGHVDLIASDLERLDRARGDERFVAGDDPDVISRSAAVIICVPTPVDEHLNPDLDALRRACETVVERAVAGQVLILTSTTYVGCTQDLLVEPLRRRGFDVGVDVHVSFSPERIDPGNARHAQQDVPRVVAGHSPDCLQAAQALLGRAWRQLHPVSTLGAAEMSKLVENTFRAVNIAYANEIADVCRALGLDVREVIRAADTKPYGFMRFLPGPGVGGHCIPCDPHYLLWQMRSHRLPTPLIAQAMTSIALRPSQVVERARELLSSRGLGLSGARILLVGITYKPDVRDLRESPAVEILERLRDQGAIVGYVDPLVPTLRLEPGLVATTRPPEEFGADLVLVHTLHTGTDTSWIEAHPLVLDATYRLPGVAAAHLL
ncbi:MAG TPA: nucleotide sugar dehydrogenase [Kineosporiaceae bacterium]|nr:nucleotide sugar dehydrogenase [Kineosporiaceae bacterium]